MSALAARELAAAASGQFAKWKNLDHAPVNRIYAANEARRLYEQARRHDVPAEDRTRLTRNQGVVCLRLLQSEDFLSRSTDEVVAGTARDAAVLLCEALSLAEALDYPNASDRLEAAGKIRGAIGEVCKGFMDFLIDRITENRLLRVSKLEKLLKSLGEREVVAKLGLLECAIKQLLLISDLALDPSAQSKDPDWRGSLGALEDARRWIVEMEACKNMVEESFPDFYWFSMDDGDDYRERLEKSSTRTKCLKSLSVAEGMLMQLVDLNESLDLDLAWQIVDELTYCGKAAEGSGEVTTCIAEQLMAHAKLGTLYHRVLKMDDRAMPYLMSAMELSVALAEVDGSAFFNKRWYLDAKNALEEIRETRAEEERRARDRERGPILFKLRPLLDKLDGAVEAVGSKRGKALALVRFLAANHQGKKAEHMSSFTSELAGIPDMADDSFNKKLLKTLRKSSLVYHPDKNKDYGSDWKVLCEEISKRVNCANSNLKGL